MPEEYFYFVGELRNFSKKQVDEFLKQFEDLFNGEILGGKKFIRDLSKGNQKKVGNRSSANWRPRGYHSR